MTEVGHKDETVRDQGLITSLALDVTLFYVVFVYYWYFRFSVQMYLHSSITMCYIVIFFFLLNLIL